MILSQRAVKIRFSTLLDIFLLIISANMLGKISDENIRKNDKGLQYCN
jgi:hypothetical protein